MWFDVIILFLDFFIIFLNLGLLGRVFNKNIVKVNLVNFCNYIIDKYKKVDDEFYGGGVGMVLKLEFIFVVVELLLIFFKWEVILLIF